MKEWGAFVLLGLIWGSSFLWIKIGVGEIGPATLSAIRLLFGLIGLLIVARVTRQPFRHLRANLPSYLFMGFFSPQGVRGNIWGQIAMLGASISYATAATFSRRYLRGHPPLVQATMVVLIADAVIWAAVPAIDRPWLFPHRGLIWFALVWLGFLGSCVAYLLYFHLLNAWGATRASLVTYVFPVVGLLLGIIFLGEVADWHLIVGSALVVGGIAVVNLRGIAGARKRGNATRAQET